MKSSSHYRFIEHGGDIEIEVSGKGFMDLLANCIESSADVIIPLKGLEINSNIELEYEFSDSMNLLVQILTDIIGEFEVNDTLYFRLDSCNMHGKKAGIRLSGHRFPETPGANTILKAATYHNLVFDPQEGRARITFDL